MPGSSILIPVVYAPCLGLKASACSRLPYLESGKARNLISKGRY